MSLSRPVTPTEWRTFLSDYSSTFLNSRHLREADEDGRAEFMVSPAQREAGWLGDEPASEEAVTAVEERFGVRLPPSYRNFLLTSNGWSCIGLIDLLRVDEIGWFLENELPECIAPWTMAFAEYMPMLRRCLLISRDEGGSGGNWLLHADSVRADGEWTAYEWWPNDGEVPEPFESFAALAGEAVKVFAEIEEEEEEE